MIFIVFALAAAAAEVDDAEPCDSLRYARSKGGCVDVRLEVRGCVNVRPRLRGIMLECVPFCGNASSAASTSSWCSAAVSTTDWGTGKA